jgi:hypothetical protein
MKLFTSAWTVMLSIVVLLATTSVAQEPGQRLESDAKGSQEMIAAAAPAPAALDALEPAMLPVAPQPASQRFVSSESGPSHRQILTWRGLVLAQHSAAVFDAWSTRNAIQSGNGYERDPLMRPFANSAAIYPMLQIMPAGFDFLSHRMMRSQNLFLRRTWWIPQTVSIAGSLWSGSRNVHVANLKR